MARCRIILGMGVLVALLGTHLSLPVSHAGEAWTQQFGTASWDEGKGVAFTASSQLLLAAASSIDGFVQVYGTDRSVLHTSLLGGGTQAELLMIRG